MSFEWNEPPEDVRSGYFRIGYLESNPLDQRRPLQFREGVKVRNFFVVDELVLLLGVLQFAVDDVTAECQAVGQHGLGDLKWNIL